jgi:hypothetical protein
VVLPVRGEAEDGGDAPVHVALGEEPGDVEPGWVAALFDLLVVALDVGAAVVGEWAGFCVSACGLQVMECLQANSRQHSVVLDLVFQRRQLRRDGLAFLGLFAVLLGGNGLVHIIDGTSLVSHHISTYPCFAIKDSFSIMREASRRGSHTMIMGHLSRAE